MLTERVYLETSGDGYWSWGPAKAVKLTKLSLPYVNDEQDFGELRVYFDKKTWNNNLDGLIYTDSLFIAQLRSYLTAQGIVADVDYSEQGMQGDNYVSLDVGASFIASWERKFNTRLA